MSTLLVIAAAVLYAVPARLFAGHFAWWQVENWYDGHGGHGKQDDGADWTLAALGGLLWPIALALFVARIVMGRLFGGMPAIGAEKRYRESQREKEHRERAEELEMPER